MIRLFFAFFVLGALLCLGISLTLYPWNVSTVNLIGAVLVYAVVTFVVAFVVAWWISE